MSIENCEAPSPLGSTACSLNDGAANISAASGLSREGSTPDSPSEVVKTTTNSEPTRRCWGRVKKYVVDPRRMSHKYFLHVLICLFIPGPYYLDGIIGTYKGPITDAMHMSNSQFGLLVSLSALTGVVCGPCGFLIVRFGRTRVALAAGLSCALGSLFTVLGFSWQLYGVMLLARLMFGLGMYVLLLVQTLLVYDIFKGRALGIAVSLIITACRMGGVFGFVLSGPLLHRFQLIGSLWIAAYCVFVAFGATLLFAYLFHGTTTARAVRPLLGRSPVQVKKCSMALIGEVPKSVMAIICAIGCLYGTVFPFEFIAGDMLQRDFGFNADLAGYTLTLIPVVSLASPLFATFLGNTACQLLCSSAMGLCAIVLAQLILYTRGPWVPFVGFSLMGIGYVISVCALWTLLPFLIRESVPTESVKEIEGLATGLSYAVLAVCQVVSNVATGVIKDIASYRFCSLYLTGSSCFGVLAVVAAATWRKPVGDMNLCPTSVQVEADGFDFTQGAEVVVHAQAPPLPSLNENESTGSMHENYYAA